MKARDLKQFYAMQPHIEHGEFIVDNYEHTGEGRAASGMIYYYVEAGEWTKFHAIDCGEYWCYVEGDPLEIWQVDESGQVSTCIFGVGEGRQPVVYFRPGVLFASRSCPGNTDGTFLSCITVPRYADEGFRLYEKEEMLALYPAVRAFFED